MPEFRPITTQEEFDAAIRDRLERERNKYADYEQLRNQVSTLTAERDAAVKREGAANAKIKTYETNSVKMRIAQDKGIPAGMALRLSGETEEEITQDAENLAQILQAAKGPAPLLEVRKSQRYSTPVHEAVRSEAEK